METIEECALGRHCIKHRLSPDVSDIVARRVFSLLIDSQFSMDELQRFWLVARGQE